MKPVMQLDIRREARARQGTLLNLGRKQYLILGDQKKAEWAEGAEGLVHVALEQGTQVKYRIKCFWEPDQARLERSRHLVNQHLADLDKPVADVLAGAPFNVIESIGGNSRFALLMKNVEGRTWKDLREEADQTGVYPPLPWPSLRTRLLWVYGLVCAVEKMEERGFVHADLSPGNLVVTSAGERAGDMALVDFDAYFHPQHQSKYRGTDGFVAPEIWNRGSIGIGSDRVAMCILIQDILMVGDPRLGAHDAFASHYTQEQICALQARAYPAFAQWYPWLGGLLDATLRTGVPGERPAPVQWREALLPLYQQSAPEVPPSCIDPHTFEITPVAPGALTRAWAWLRVVWMRLITGVRSLFNRRAPAPAPLSISLPPRLPDTPAFDGPESRGPPPLPPQQPPAEGWSFLTVGLGKLDTYIRMGDVQRARIVLDELCEEYPDHPSVAKQLARLRDLERTLPASRPVEAPRPVPAPQPVAAPHPDQAPQPVAAPRPVQAPHPDQAPQPVEAPQHVQAQRPVEAQRPMESPWPVEEPRAPHAPATREIVTRDAPSHPAPLPEPHLQEPPAPRLQRQAATLAQRGDLAGAAALLSDACAQYPGSADLRRDYDAVLREIERQSQAAWRRPAPPAQVPPDAADLPSLNVIVKSSDWVLWVIFVIVVAILMVFAYLFFQSS